MGQLAGMIDKPSLLAANQLLRHLAPKDLEALARHARIERHRERDVIFRKGDPGQSMLVVVKGRVRITCQASTRREVVLNIVGPGEVVGEIALLDGEPRTADAVAIGDVELLVLARRDFLPFLARHHDVCVRLLVLLCRRIRRTSDQVEDLVFLEQPARLAKTLLRLATAQGGPSETGTTLSINLGLSQSELGALVGMRRESVNRQLRQWAADGTLSLQRRRILIHAPDRLNRIVGGSL